MARSIVVAAWCGVVALALAGCAGSNSGPDSGSPAGPDAGTQEPVAASFEIRAVAEQASVVELPASAECARAPLAPSESGWMCVDATSIAYLVEPVALTAVDVATVEVGPNAAQGSSGWMLNVTLTDTGATAFAELTAEAAEATPPANQVAVLVDGEVMSAPSVMEAITGGAIQLAVDGDEAEAQALAAAMMGASGAQE